MKITESKIEDFVVVTPYMSDVDPTTTRYKVEYDGQLYLDTCSLQRAKEEQKRIIKHLTAEINEAIKLLVTCGFTVK